MNEKEYIQKSKSLLQEIVSIYQEAWYKKILKDTDFPDENVCNQCTGCGKFLLNDEEEECIANRIDGECYYFYIDYEEIGHEISKKMKIIYELLNDEGELT